MSAKSQVVGSVIHTYLRALSAKQALYGATRWLHGGRRRARLFYRADDPYSHLLAQVAPRLVSAFGMRVEVICVAPPTTAAWPEPELLLQHAMRDAALLAQSYGLSFPADAKPPPEDRVRRAHAVLLQSRSPDESLELAIALGEAVWRDDGKALAALVERHGSVSGQEVRPALEANHSALERAGHYQPGMLEYGGDWYWGIDRLHFLEARLRGEGLDGSLGLSRGPAPLLAEAIASRRGERLRVEAFVSFRSPYSYLSLPQLIELRERHGIEIALRPVLPMVMRGLPVPRSKKLYIAKDAKREADRLGIPFGRIYDPLGRGIGHCLALFFGAAVPRGLEVELTHSLMRGIWSEARDVAHLPDLIAMAGGVGIEEAEVRAALEDESWKEKAVRNREALAELGLWGVPALRIGAYRTWGQDRLPFLEAEIARLSGAR